MTLFALVGVAEAIPLLVFAAFVAGVFAVLTMISNRNSRAAERLDRLSRPMSRTVRSSGNSVSVVFPEAAPPGVKWVSISPVPLERVKSPEILHAPFSVSCHSNPTLPVLYRSSMSLPQSLRGSSEPMLATGAR